MKSAVNRRSQSPVDQSSFYMEGRGTPVGASDDESPNRNNTSSPHSIISISDEQLDIFEHNSLKRSDSLQGTNKNVYNNNMSLQTIICS